MSIQPKEKYVLTFPQDESGNTVTKYRFMLSLGKKIAEVEGPLQNALGTLDGIDQVALQPLGRYTVEVVIARSFDAEEVIAELERRLTNDVMSDIIQPTKTIVTP